MNKQRKDILLEERGKFSLDTAKPIIGGVILAGIMRTDVFLNVGVYSDAFADIR